MDMKVTCEGDGATFWHGGHSVAGITAERPQSHAIRNGLICALVVAGCIWATYPVAEMGFIDDWSYARTAQVFALTGRFVYNGWSAMILGWQIVWGALFIKLFGFSFTVVRLSILPIAMAAIFLFHVVLVRFGVNARNAVLGALTLGLSPLFLPLASSYMTDIPALFVIVLCLCLCQWAVAAESSKAIIVWLGLAAATNVVGGTVRQIAWLGALVMVPSAGWLLRKRSGVLFASSLLWIISAASIFACMRWFARQPYSVPEPLLIHAGVISWYVHSFARLPSNAIYLLMFVYPILIAWLPKLRTLNRGAFPRIAVMTATLFFFQWATTGTISSLPHVILSLLVIVTVLVLLEHQNLWPRVENKKVQFSLSADLVWLLGPFSLCYFLLLLTREITFDKYLLPLMPMAIICLLRLHQQWIAPTLSSISVVAVGIFALFAIGGTHDWFAWSRARLIAINEIRTSGVPRTEIQGGFEYDGWTQIEEAGYINNPRLAIPAGAYHPDAPFSPVPADCRADYYRRMPALHPKFTVIFPRMWCLEPSKYPTVNYRSWLPPYNYRNWLPPYNREILVQHIPDL